MAIDTGTAKRPTWTNPTWLRGLLALGTMAAALALLGLGWRRTGLPLVVEVDGHRFQQYTHAATVGEGLRRAGLDLYPEDVISPGLETPLQPGTVVRVQRARLVALSVDGQMHHLRTHARTVRELFTEAGLVTGPSDEIWLRGQQVALDAPLGHKASGSVAGEALNPPTITLRRAASITLNDGRVTRTLDSTLTTVGQVLQEHGITLFLGDGVSPGLQDRIVPGMTITIDRSVPVQIEMDGYIVHTRTRVRTVAGLLGQAGIALMGQDRAEPDMAQTIQPNMTVRITRVHQDYIVDFEPIPFDTVWVADPEVEIDNIRLVREGQLGLTKRRKRVTYENGEEVARLLEDVWTEQSPVTKTMAYGTKIVVRSMDTPDGPVEYWRKMRVYLTSYKPASCGKPRDHPRYGYTRLGWKLKKGIVAVDPTVIPLKTSMYVPGYGLARAGDTGGGVKGKFVDLGFSDEDYESWHWWADIYLLTPVPPPDKIRWVLPNWPRFPDRRR